MQYLKKNLYLILLMMVFSTLLLAADTEKKDDKNMTDLTAKKVNVTIQTNQGNIELELWPDMAPKTVENFVKLSNEGFYTGTYFHRVIPDFMIQGGDPNTKDSTRANDGQGGPDYTFEDECYAGEGTPLTGKIKTDEEAHKVWMEIIMPYLQSNKEPNPDIKAIADSVMAKQSGAPIMEKTYEFFYDTTGKEPIIDPSSMELKHSVDYGNICMANSGPNTNGSQFFIVTKKEGCSWLNGKHTVFGKVTKGMDVVHKIEALPRDKNDNPNPDNQAIIQKITIKE